MPTLPHSSTLPLRGRPKATADGVSSSNTASSQTSPTTSPNISVRYETSITDARCEEGGGKVRKNAGKSAEANETGGGVGKGGEKGE